MKSQIALFLVSASAAFAGFSGAKFVDFVPTGTNTPLSASFTWNGADITSVGVANVPNSGLGVFRGETLVEGTALTVSLTVYDLGASRTSIPLILDFSTDLSMGTYIDSFSVTVYGFQPVNPLESIDSVNIIASNSLNSDAFVGSYNVNNQSLTFSSVGGFNLPSSGGNLFADFSTSTSAVPEPSTFALGFGVAAVGYAVWRRRSARK